MSKTQETTERIGLTLRNEEDRELFEDVREAVSDRRDVPAESLANVDVFRYAAEGFLSDRAIHRLREDKRVGDVREYVANDLDMDPSEVSFEAAILQACAAYAGYARVDDWETGQ